jgi:1-deoxy-D-xylulose-5-phosphate reductoisomerase
MIKSITVLGASGSVGSQVLKVLEDRNDYKLVAFSCWKNIDFVKEALKKFKTVEFVCVAYESDAENLKKEFNNVRFYYGDDGLLALIKEANSDVYENSILGFAGLYPSIEVLKLNKTLLLSNKESLVVGGEFINDLLNKGFGKLYPIDSEHVAISKCLYGEDFSKIDHIVLTASGGKFFNYSREELNKVTLDDGILNPNWKMGKKISVDSNTMFNKMFEIVEAHYLFKLPYEKIKVVVDRKSYVHSFVVFDDKTKLQVGKPTMIDPIIYALNFGLPKNEKNEFEDVEINTEKNYKFDEVNISRFPVLTLAKKIIEEKGSLGCVINAFDEVLVDAFLKKKIEFKDIDVIIFKILNEYKFDKKCSLNDLRKIDLDARKFALKYIEDLRIE